MTSSNGNIFRVTGHLCGEFTGRMGFVKWSISHVVKVVIWLIFTNMKAFMHKAYDLGNLKIVPVSLAQWIGVNWLQESTKMLI